MAREVELWLRGGATAQRWSYGSEVELRLEELRLRGGATGQRWSYGSEVSEIRSH